MDIVLQNFDYNGRVISRRNDGFINLTQMCQANGKQINDFFRLKSTKEYLEALETETGIPVTGLYQVFQGGTQNQGTWGHPMVALRLAQWISPAFAVWCDAHIFNLMSTGSTSLEIDPIEEMKLKIELARLERDKADIDNKSLNLRHIVVSTCPDHIQQRILGYTEIKQIEYRDRVYHDDQLIRDGSTLNKTQLCKRYKILTRNGSPDYRKLNKMLENVHLPSEAWKLTAAIQENTELHCEYLPELDRLIFDADRQMFLGE